MFCLTAGGSSYLVQLHVHVALSRTEVDISKHDIGESDRLPSVEVGGSDGVGSSRWGWVQVHHPGNIVELIWKTLKVMPSQKGLSN